MNFFLERKELIHTELQLFKKGLILFPEQASRVILEDSNVLVIHDFVEKAASAIAEVMASTLIS